MLGVNPQRLKEARIIRGLTAEELGNRLSITKQAVSKYENRKSNPSPETIEKIVSTLNVPVSYLTNEDLTIESTLKQSAFFFRKKKQTLKADMEYARIKLKWASEINSALYEITQTTNNTNLPDFMDSLSIEEKANELRYYWDVGLGPIENITRLMENNGIAIYSLDTKKEIDAYSQIVNGIPFVVVNCSRGSAVRWRFDLAHELGHIILHKDVDANELEDSERYKHIEKEANRFASAFLLPEITFSSSLAGDKMAYFKNLKTKWGVSIAAMIYRAEQLRLISNSKAESLWSDYSTRGWRKKEPFDDEILHEKPTRVSDMVREFVKDLSSASALLAKVRMSVFDIEEMCTIDQGFFSTFKVIGEEHLFKAIDYKGEYQMSLFN